MSPTPAWTKESLFAPVLPVDKGWRNTARQRLDTLTKPLGSLGRLEDVAAQFVAIRGAHWSEPVRKGVYVFAADHGVTAEGVSAYPSKVTQQMVLNFVRGGAAVNVLARLHRADLTVIDVGVAGEFAGADGVVHRKVAKGTRNMRHEPAMSEEEMLAALAVGADMANRAAERGQNVVAVGEMGIGNTTSASAIACALTGASVDLVTGRGTGITEEVYARKVRVVDETVRRYFGAASPAPAETILRCVGGLEIAAMTGMILQCARLRIALVIDGFISTAAAALAAALAPPVAGYLFAGHRSEERGHRVLLDHLALQPLLTLGMRLGEGSGAVLALPLIEAAMALYAQMATFESAGVSEASV